MPVKSLIEDVEQDVLDVLNTEFKYYTTKNVPSSEDGGLTFESGIEKKGKVLKSCVLFVDIRNSVALTQKHQNKTMGKVYTAFTKAVSKVARHHQGFVRNIIGDRVMVVFPENNCFTNAVDCAISINHIAQYVINKKFNIDFKCGIGIDYGELRITKVGTKRKGDERIENKGLVWVGYPANYASRLTDVAHKTLTEELCKVTWNKYITPEMRAMLAVASFKTGIQTPVSTSDYADYPETVEMSLPEFAKSISSVRDGEMHLSGGKYIKHSIETKSTTYHPIVMTEAVYNGFKEANPNRNCIKKNYWSPVKSPAEEIKGDVYHADVHWIIK